MATSTQPHLLRQRTPPHHTVHHHHHHHHHHQRMPLHLTVPLPRRRAACTRHLHHARWVVLALVLVVSMCIGNRSDVRCAFFTLDSALLGLAALGCGCCTVRRVFRS
jgi:hypothetical protein